jgi:hypothetical protein
MGYWHGSGTLGYTASREIVCSEKCSSCEDDKKTCDAVWEEDFETDDYGNIEADVECKTCKHTYTFREESC